MRRSLVWKIYLTYLILIALCAVLMTAYALESAKTFQLRRTRQDLESRAWFVKEAAAERLRRGEKDGIDALCKALGAASSTRVTVIDPSGAVIGESQADITTMENHADRPEVQTALAGSVGASERQSPTIKVATFYVAVPITVDGRIVAVARVAEPLDAVYSALARTYLSMIAGAAAVAVLAAGIGLLLSRSITKPLFDLKAGADRFARGDLRYKLLIPESREMAGLAEALNVMASQLDEKIRTVNRQKSELQAVLSSMTEGILAVDGDQRIVMTNHAAVTLLGATVSDATGRLLQEAVRNVDVLRVVNDVLSSQEPVQLEITTRQDGGRLIEVHGSTLRDAAGLKIGALLVIADVTRLRRLESIRRDFVANVSHELKTPVTSIKGFVETLREGALVDPERASRFLDIVAKQADRLNAIIEDLLTLSRIEQESERYEIVRQEVRLCDAVQSAVTLCQPKAEAKNIAVAVACSRDIVAKVNELLIEQAVTNLIDNAIKYSQPGSSVQVQAARTASEVVITVRDRGCGIPAEHLPRIFERFYRVDKARSRSLGGTGLGLAIVKHIAQAHGGTVAVESTLGEGSAFTIRMPV